MAILFFLLLALHTLAQKPSMKAALDNPTLTLLKDVAVGEISKNMPDIHLLDFEEDIIVAKVTAQNITMHVQPFDASQVGIELLEGTNDFIIRGHNLTMNGSLALIVKVLFTTYHCTGYMKAAHSGFSARISLLKNGTRLAVEVKSVSIELDKENVDIRIEGDVIKKIINALISFLKAYFFETIKKSMSEMLPDMIANVTNTILSSLPDDVEVMKGVSAKFTFPTPPAVRQNYIIAPIFTYVHMSKDPHPPPYNPPELPDLNATCHKGVQMFISDYIIKSAVETAHKAGILEFHKKLSALGFDITVDCTSNSTPAIKFQGDIEFAGSSYCFAKFVLKGTHYKFELGFLANMTAALTEVMKDSKIYFNIEKMAVTALKIVFGVVIDLKTLISFVNMYLEEVKGTINKEIANKGIPLPSFPLFDLSDITQGLSGHHIFVCGSLKKKKGWIKYNYVKDYYYNSPVRNYYY